METRLSERLDRVRVQVTGRGGSFVAGMNPFIRDVALWKAMRHGRSRVQVRAALLRELVELAPVMIPDDWRLAGEHLVPHQWGSFGFAGKVDESARHLLTLDVAETDHAAVRDAVMSWTGATPDAGSVSTGEVTDADAAGRGGWGREDSETVYWSLGWMENHSIRDYAKVLRIGFSGIKQEIVGRLDSADRSDAAFPQQENFWRAAISVCDAGILLGKRYAACARSMAEVATKPAERRRLAGIADLCSRVPAEGAETFEQAVQALWLAHILTCGEDGINANSIGRLDQILFPFYERDTAAGRLTRDKAVEWMVELACKLYLDYDVQAITLGGLLADGNDAVNPLSHDILEATRQAGFIRDLCVRLHDHTPVDFIEQAAGLVVQGGGIPFFFNDQCFVPALVNRGIAVEDARNYAPIGCIELTVPGRANPHAVSGWFNSTKCLELALFDGRDPRSGVQLGPRTGVLTEMDSFEEFYRAYAAQVEHFATRMVYHCNRGELAQRERGPLPCWSTLTDDCIARGRDITDGGAVYNYHSICFLGTANTADALMVLKSVVFEKGTVSRKELLRVLQANFDGGESLRQRLLHETPKYGNDEPAVDALAARIDADFINLMDRMRSPLGGRYFVHLFSFLCNIAFGKTVGATPDGRRAGEPLAYSLSAHQGRDVEGVTAMLNSLAKLPHAEAAGASAAIVEIDPVLVAGESGVRRLVTLLQTAVAQGVGQLQWNVVTAERLREAQKDPERRGNIAVRVAGFSQMFRLIDRELQEHIIARTKHRR